MIEYFKLVGYMIVAFLGFFGLLIYSDWMNEESHDWKPWALPLAHVFVIFGLPLIALLLKRYT